MKLLNRETKVYSDNGRLEKFDYHTFPLKHTLSIKGQLENASKRHHVKLGHVWNLVLAILKSLVHYVTNIFLSTQETWWYESDHDPNMISPNLCL